MGRRVDVDDLVGVAEIAKRLNVKVTTIHQWRWRHEDFPPHVVQLGTTFGWVWSDVEQWAAKRGKPNK